MDCVAQSEPEKTSLTSFTATDNASPASLCENEAPITECEPAKPVNGLTLGQTLKDELRRSCLRISMDKKPKEETPVALFENIQPLFDNVPCDSPTALATPPPSATGTPSADPNSEKRRRPRRNPVWQHFVVEDGLAKCSQCDYSTKSVFSTNLKVHLKSHHKELHQQVLQAEEQMALATAKFQNGNAQRSPKEIPRILAPRRFPTHLSAVDQQRLLELQQRIMSSNGLPVRIFGNGGQQHQQTAAAVQMNEPTSSMKVLTDLLSTQTPLASAVKQEKLTPFDALIKHEPLPDFSNELALSGSPMTPAPTPDLNSATAVDRRQKRKRLRRHPVWQFFCDVDEKIVGCVMCSFRTISAFSTNLKMHLKAHHKEEYLKVMEQELEQRQDEEAMGAGSEESGQSQEANGRIKRRRRTVEELQVIIDKAKSTLEKDKSRRSSVGSVVSMIQANGNAMPTLDPEKMMAMSATEKLEAMVGFMCTSDNGLFDAAPPPAAAEYSDSDHRNSTEGSPSPAHSSADGFGGDAIANAESNPEDFRELMLQINKIPCEGTNGEFVRNFKRQTQRLMLSKLVKRAGSPALFLTPEFQNFVLSWAPDFRLPSADELQSMLVKNTPKH